MPKDLDDLKRDFASIPLPPEVDLSIAQGLAKGKKARTAKRILRPLAIAATVVMVFALSVNFSPAFAGYASDHGLEFLVNLFGGDRGMSQVLERGYSQAINESASDQDITLTVENAVYDGRRLHLLIRLDTERQVMSLWPGLTELFGVNFRCMTNVSDADAIRYWLEYSFANDIPEEWAFNCNSIELLTAEGYETITGNWTVLFHLDPELAKCKPILVQLNRKVATGEVKFTVETLALYPTTAEVNIRLNPDNPVRITSFKNPRLIDKSGNEYNLQHQIMLGEVCCLSLASPFFSGDDELTLVFDGVYTLPLESTCFVLDAENGAILEDGGLGIEYLKTTYSECAGIHYRVYWVRPLDPEYVESEPQFFEIGGLAQDGQGNQYSVHRFVDELDSGERIYGVAIEESLGNPATLRVEVREISKGCVEPTKLRIKIN